MISTTDLRALPNGARACLALMGCGYRLCLPRTDRDTPLLVNWAPYNSMDEWLSPIAVDPSDAQAVVNTGLLGELPERTTNGKVGWREGRMPGETHKVFAFIQ